MSGTVFGVLHLSVYSILTITNLAQAMYPLFTYVENDSRLFQLKMSGITSTQLESLRTRISKAVINLPPLLIRRPPSPGVVSARKTVSHEG